MSLDGELAVGEHPDGARDLAQKTGELRINGGLSRTEFQPVNTENDAVSVAKDDAVLRSKQNACEGDRLIVFAPFLVLSFTIRVPRKACAGFQRRNALAEGFSLVLHQLETVGHARHGGVLCPGGIDDLLHRCHEA